MELSCEVRGPLLWVPRNREPELLSILPQRQRQPGWSLSLQQPRGLLGGASTSESLDSAPKREKGVGIMCRGRSCREPPTARCPLPRSAFMFQPFLPFPDTPPSALEALPPGLPDRGN